MVSCHEASFARAHCRLDVELDTAASDDAKYFVVMHVVDLTGVVRPLVLPDGHTPVISGSAELHAVSLAVHYLEGLFGAFCEITYDCHRFVEAASLGPPVVVSVSPVAR